MNKSTNTFVSLLKSALGASNSKVLLKPPLHVQKMLRLQIGHDIFTLKLNVLVNYFI